MLSIEKKKYQQLMNQKAETKLGNHRGQCLIRRANIARIFFLEKRFSSGYVYQLSDDNSNTSDVSFWHPLKINVHLWSSEVF